MKANNKTTAPVVQTLGFDNMPKPIVDAVSASVEYRGYAPLGVKEDEAGWMLERKTISGSVTRYEYAQGKMSFEFKFSERSTYTYSR